MSQVNFSACFSGPSCLQGVGAFFCNTKSHYTKKCTSVDFYDKLLKVVEQGLKSGTGLAQELHASKETMNALYKTETAVMTTRQIVSLANIFKGVIPAMIEQITVFAVLFIKLFSQHAAAVKKDYTLYEYPDQIHYPLGHSKQVDEAKALLAPVQTDVVSGSTHTRYGKYNDFATTAGEKGVAMLSKGAAFVASAGYLVGFGAMRPIEVADRLVFQELKQEIDPKAREISTWFPVAMFGNHAAGFVHHCAEMGFQTMAYEREEQANRANPTKYSEFRRQMRANILGGVAKGAELGLDGYHFLGGALPWWGRLILGVGSAVCDFVKEIEKVD